MNVESAAQIFHDWAVQESLLAGPIVEPKSNAADMSEIFPRTEQGRQILRTKQVESLGVDPASHEITVFTRRVAPKAKKQLEALPQRVGDVDIRYRQGHRESIGDAPPVASGAPIFRIRTINGNEKYTCGSSISVANCLDAGTLGCLVRDASGALYGLSNNHVSGGCSYANVGMPVLAPGVFDVAANSILPFTIGLHHRSLPLLVGTPDNVKHVDNLDASIFKIAEIGRISSYQGDAYDTPTLVAPIQTQMVVEKYGRTTGLTTGTVTDRIFGPMPIRYNASRYGFTGDVFFEPLYRVVGRQDLFSDNGDSGSLVTTVDAAGNRLGVGLIVGGGPDDKAPGKKFSLVLPLDLILRRFGVTLVGGHNV